MPTEGHSFKYFMQHGTEQLMVDICGFWAVPQPGWEDSLKPYKPFLRSAHTRVTWLMKMQFYSNVRQFLKLIFCLLLFVYIEMSVKVWFSLEQNLCLIFMYFLQVVIKQSEETACYV